MDIKTQKQITRSYLPSIPNGQRINVVHAVLPQDSLLNHHITPDVPIEPGVTVVTGDCTLSADKGQIRVHVNVWGEGYQVW